MEDARRKIKILRTSHRKVRGLFCCQADDARHSHIRVHRAGILTDSFEALKSAWLLRLKIEGSCDAEHS